MTPFMRNVMARIDVEHEQRIVSMRGESLPKQPRARADGEHQARALEAQKRQADFKATMDAVVRAVASGDSVADICARLGLTERQYYWWKAKARAAESSRGVVTR